MCNWFQIGSLEIAYEKSCHRRLEAGHFTHSDKSKLEIQKRIKRRMGRFMAVVKHSYALAEDVWIGEKDDEVSAEKVKKLWETVEWKHIMTKYTKPDASKTTTKAWASILNAMQRSGAFRENRNTCKDDDEWKLSIHNKEITMEEIKNDDRSHLRPNFNDDD